MKRNRGFTGDVPPAAPLCESDIRAASCQKIVELLGAASKISEQLRLKDLNYFISMARIEAEAANFRLRSGRTEDCSVK